MRWVAKLGSWVKRQRKRFGLWLCKHCGHKNKRVVGMDWASSGDMIAEADVCQRCDLITIVDVRKKPVRVITDMAFEGMGLMPDGTVRPRIRVDRHAPTALEIKSAEELVEGFYDARKNWTSRETDPKADMTVVIKNCLPMHRACIIEGFDPDHVVWTEEERRVMLEAPIEYNEEDFKPTRIHLCKENIELLKANDDKNCIHCGRGLYTVHEQDRGECSRCEKGDER